MKSILILAISGLLCACGPSSGPSIEPSNPASEKLGFLPNPAQKGSLFKYYQAREDSKWLNNWTAKLDLTGVSWNDTRCATAISPSYVVMAAHYTRPTSVPLMFHDRNGKPHERFIAKIRPLIGVGDITVAQLNRPLPPEIKSYRFAKASEAKIGEPVIITDQTSTLSVHQIASISGNVISFSNIPNLNPIYSRKLVVGDSGHPSFLVKNGELLLLETHTTGGPGAGPFYGSPPVQAAIREAIRDMEK